MGCSYSLKNCHYKSAQTAVNDTTQTLTAALTPIAVLGNLVTDTGCSIDTQNGGFLIKSAGLYRISFDVTYTAGGAGTEALGLYNNGVAMPCATSQQTVADATIYQTHVETIVYIPSCCGASATITAQMSGVAATVNHVCASALKLA